MVKHTKFRFGFGSDTSSLPYKGGVHHTDDLQYLFPYPPENTKLNEDDVKIAKRMVNLWTSFAETGVPTAEDVPKLKPMTSMMVAN
jgi:acetylcholinesterase